MAKKKQQTEPSSTKRTLLEWGVIAVVIGVLYLTGLHTSVLATMQRAVLYTGLFNAQQTELSDWNGPFLDEQDYSFRMTTADGETVTLGDFREQIVFINVWASWCPPCIAEMPTIESLYSQLGNHPDIGFIMLALDEDRQDSIEFMERRGYSMPYQFPISARPPALRSSYLPTTYVISKEGQIIYQKEGIADYSSRNFREWLVSLAEDEEPL